MFICLFILFCSYLWSRVMDTDRCYIPVCKWRNCLFKVFPAIFAICLAITDSCWLHLCKRTRQPHSCHTTLRASCGQSIPSPNHSIIRVSCAAALHQECEHIRKMRNVSHPSRPLRAMVWRALCLVLFSLRRIALYISFTTAKLIYQSLIIWGSKN